MSDFLERLAARALGVASVVQPRVASRYASLARAGLPESEPEPLHGTPPPAWVQAPPAPIARTQAPSRFPTPASSTSGTLPPAQALPARRPAAMARRKAGAEALERSAPVPERPAAAEQAPHATGEDAAPLAVPAFAARTPETTTAASRPDNGWIDFTLPVPPLAPPLPPGQPHPAPAAAPAAQGLATPAAAHGESSAPPVHHDSNDIGMESASPFGSTPWAGAPAHPAAHARILEAALPASAAAPGAPLIRVSIGRVEVRAAPALLPPAASVRPAAPALSLDAYLRQRAGGSR